MSNSNSDNSDSVNSSSPKVKRKRKSKASGPEAPPDFQTAQERVREALRNSPKNSRPPPPPPRPDESEDFSIEELLAFDRYDDPDALIGKFRWLTRGSSLIVQGYTGIGKSSLLLQMAMHWSLGRDFFGMWIQKPFRCLFIQAENNRGDIAEPFQDICRNVLGIEPTSPEIKVFEENLIIKRQASKAGIKQFIPFVREQIALYKPDLAFFDPLLSYFGGNISDQEMASEFVRNQLQPIQNETGVVFVFAHHLGKPKADEANHAPAVYLGLGSSEFPNWAREIITVKSTAQAGLYQVDFGKRPFRTGLADNTGKATDKVFIQQASEGKSYWTLAKNITNPAQLKEQIESGKLAKLYDLIVKHKTITLQNLLFNKDYHGIAKNKLVEAIEKLVEEKGKTEWPIYFYERKTEGRQGRAPRVVSINPPPSENNI